MALFGVLHAQAVAAMVAVPGGWDPGLTRRLAAGAFPHSPHFTELCPDASSRYVTTCRRALILQLPTCRNVNVLGCIGMIRNLAEELQPLVETVRTGGSISINIAFVGLVSWREGEATPTAAVPSATPTMNRTQQEKDAPR